MEKNAIVPVCLGCRTAKAGLMVTIHRIFAAYAYFLPDDLRLYLEHRRLAIYLPHELHTP